ncbi:MAG: hypothetical protein ACE5J5_06020 [Candidatus Hydrothermarchaeales archaeon]
MSDTQIIFRVEKEILKKLDKTLKTSGFKTRNEWFRNTVHKHLEEIENKKTQNLMKRLATEGMTEDDIIQMIKERKQKELEKIRKQAKEQREREWIRDSRHLKNKTPEETIKLMFELTNFAEKINKAEKCEP